MQNREKQQKKFVKITESHLQQEKLFIEKTDRIKLLTEQFKNNRDKVLEEFPALAEKMKLEEMQNAEQASIKQNKIERLIELKIETLKSKIRVLIAKKFPLLLLSTGSALKNRQIDK